MTLDARVLLPRLTLYALLATGFAAAPTAQAGFVAELEWVPPGPRGFILDFDFGTDFRAVAFPTAQGASPIFAQLTALATLVNVDLSDSGCTAAEFQSFVPGRIAIIRRGTCTFDAKFQNARIAGASGVILLNNVLGPELPTLAVSPNFALPALLFTQVAGDELRNSIRANPLAQLRLLIADVPDPLPDPPGPAPAPVPEPGTLALLGVALTGLASIRRRRSA